MVDQGVFDTSFATPIESTESIQEPDELLIARFLTELADQLPNPEAFAAADIWRLRNSTRAFYSPSPAFRIVGKAHCNTMRRAPDGTPKALSELYEAHFDQLQPRAYGRTSYMVGNKKAIVLQPIAGDVKNCYWNSAPFLGFSMFIGIPFLFNSPGWPDRISISVLYIRCIGDVSQETAKAVVLRTCKMMQSDSYWRCFTPLVASAAQARTRNRWLHFTEEQLSLRLVEPTDDQEESIPALLAEVCFDPEEYAHRCVGMAD
jgi:hypothetical protein